ncbi:uncharacterized protein LOC132715784 [Ruditapes philippinarum]|uniref:uncharacterized protein LOC132715784 n=1 Tax=Ruditapes philippinarum TaxID=129788 RepID=UPI00295A9056|nr:uncharacterized protein LOC132715784 [Ruditapes philippinarum]
MELLIYSLLIGFLKQTSGVMCSQCDSDIDPFCMENPPSPVNCTLCGHFDKETYECAQYHIVEYCITERRYINDTLVRITRDCSPASMPESCEYITVHESQMKVCFKTCKFNGCNSSGKPIIFTGQYFYVILIFLQCVILWWR